MALEAEEKTLYVANLDRNVDEEVLYELFLQAGPIERVNIPSNCNDGHRYGFVTYKHECSIDYAIELYKGTRLYKKELVVKRKGERSNNQQQQMNFRNNYGDMNFNQMGQGIYMNQPQDFQQMLALAQLMMPSNMENNSNNHSNSSQNQRNDNLSLNSLRGQWSNRNRPYDRDRDSRNYSRQREHRDRRSDSQNKGWRKGRY